jgi:hypothetical protein
MLASRPRSLRLAAAITLAAGSLFAAGPAGAAMSCNGRPVTIVGTDGDDTLIGTGGTDVIHGRGGNDTIDGRGGNDVICGGGGADVIDGGAGDDRILGQRGSDTIAGRGDDDALNGGQGPDTISGGSGADTIDGGTGNDTLHGGDGADTIEGGSGKNTAVGGKGWDVCTRSVRKDACEGPVFLETFDAAPYGDPAKPKPVGSGDSITVSVNSRVGSTRDRLAPMQGQHSTNCGPPPETHLVRDYEDAVYNCKNHMMTAISSGRHSLGNYAVAMFSPNAMLDFTGGEATVQFDVSTERASARDWFEVWITPYEDLLRIPVQKDRPSMQGTPRNGVLVALKAFTRIGAPDVKVVRDFKVTDIDGPVEWVGYENFLEPSAMVRSTFEIRISKSHIAVGMPGEDFYWVSEKIPGGLDFTKAMVQIGHNSYDVMHCDECSAGPNTWHWDNVMLQPAEPITAIAASRRAVNSSTASFVTFADPAPKGAHVQFTGVGFDLEVSFDNGATWHPAKLKHNKQVFHWRYKNYWVRVPKGTTRVDFRGTDPYDGRWQIQDISILSPNAP